MAVASTRIDVFDRVVCCVNSSVGSKLALEQAAAVVSPLGSLLVVTVLDLPMTYSAYGGALVAREAERDAGVVLEQAAATCPRARTELLYGGVVERVLTELEDVRATLVVVGGHRHHRSVGALLGSTATRLVHGARTSVLVARPANQLFPHRIAVGDDGSEHAARAVAAAAELAQRHDAALRLVVTAAGDASRFDLSGVDVEVEADHRPLSDSLVAAAALADLVVIGNRGLHGLSAIGSESERVAHEAASSVLVVR